MMAVGSFSIICAWLQMRLWDHRFFDWNYAFLYVPIGYLIWKKSIWGRAFGIFFLALNVAGSILIPIWIGWLLISRGFDIKFLGFAGYIALILYLTIHCKISYAMLIGLRKTNWTKLKDAKQCVSNSPATEPATSSPASELGL